MDSDAASVSTRKRKSTSSSVVDATPKEPKRRRASAKVDDLSTQTPLSAPKTVGRKRKAAADATSDAGSVDGSVDSQQPLRRSGRKRVSNDSVSISSIPSVDSNDDLREAEPRSTRRTSARRKPVAETPPQASDTEDNFSLAESEAESIVQATPSQRATSRPSLPLPVPVAPPAPTPRSAAKRKSLSSGIAAVSVGVDTPGKQSIVHSFSPTATTPAHPRTPGITNENTTMQVAAVEEFSPNRGRPAEATAQPIQEFKLEDSNNWYSWLSAALLIVLTLGSFYRQLSMPSHQFRPPVPTVATPSPSVPANHTLLVQNVSSPTPAAASWDLPNITQITNLQEIIREEKQRSEELLQRLEDLSQEEAMISTLVELQETVQSFVEAAHANLSAVESTLLEIEADAALVPEDDVPMTDLPSAETIFDTQHDIEDDPIPIQEVIEGETKHEYRHQTDGLTPAEYEQTVQQQMTALVEHVRHETDEVVVPTINQLQQQFQNHESIGDTATVEQVVESVLSDLSGETVKLPMTATATDAAPIESLTLAAVDDVLNALEDAVAERERTIAEQVHQRDEVMETQLRTVIGASVEYVIEGDKDSLLRHVVESSAASVQEKINRMPKLDYLMDKDDEDEEEAHEQELIVTGDADATAALLATADDVASSATGARMTLLESSTYCVKQKGDPIGCASAHLRTVNSYAPIKDANDCYAFEKLHKHDALTVQFFQPSTVVGFGLSHFISTDADVAAAAATAASYSVDCAPKDVYFTMHQSSASAAAAAESNPLKPRGAFGKLLKPKGHFVTIDSGNYTFTPLSENVLREHVHAQGYTASQRFALSSPVSDVAKVTLHVRSTHHQTEPSPTQQSLACVYRLKVFALPTGSA